MTTALFSSKRIFISIGAISKSNPGPEQDALAIGEYCEERLRKILGLHQFRGNAPDYDEERGHDYPTIQLVACQSSCAIQKGDLWRLDISLYALSEELGDHMSWGEGHLMNTDFLRFTVFPEYAVQFELHNYVDTGRRLEIKYVFEFFADHSHRSSRRTVTPRNWVLL